MNGVDVPILFDQTYALLSNAHAALVTSGTATLETALFKVPEVVCYKGNPISYMIARMVVDINYISLVNLIVNKEIVKELIQSEFNPENLKKELLKLLESNHRELLSREYKKLINVLGGNGASEKAASIIVDMAS